MPVIKLKEHLTKADIKEILLYQTDVRSFKQWQIINSVACNVGKKSEDIAVILGITKEVLQRTVKQYNKYGADFQQKVPWGGRRIANSFLSLEDEQKMLEGFAKKASVGQILTFKDIKKEVETKLNKEVSDDYIWDLFKRCGWSKKEPRPKHPQQNLVAQEDFKKNSKRIWQPSL